MSVIHQIWYSNFIKGWERNRYLVYFRLLPHQFQLWVQCYCCAFDMFHQSLRCMRPGFLQIWITPPDRASAREKQRICARILWNSFCSARCITNRRYYVRTANNDLSYRTRARICIRYRRMDDGRVILLVSGGHEPRWTAIRQPESNKFRYSNRIRAVVGTMRHGLVPARCTGE